MPVSVTYAVMSALKTRLAARAGLAGVQIVIGTPWQPEADYIAIHEADPHDQRPAGMRALPGPREEEFWLGVMVSSIRKGDADHSEAVARAYTLAAELEDELGDDPTINASLGGGWAQIDGLPVTTHWLEDGTREARIAGRVKCRSRITG